jgi:4-hydroxy-tetrahydrodipicolinate reductase
MKVALFGYGKMGKEIEKILLQRGHAVSHIIDSSNREMIQPQDLADSDVAIEFSLPATAVENIRLCFSADLPVVVGTTGWFDDLNEVKKLCENARQTLLYASNFSIGVNVFFEVNRLLAKYMNTQADYDVKMKEIHHVHKKDAPSGTAISLAEDLLGVIERKSRWVNRKAQNGEELEVLSERKDDVPGTHEVVYSSEIDELLIRHTAHNRKGFALGAVLAAEWLPGKKGVFTMADVLNVNFS